MRVCLIIIFLLFSCSKEQKLDLDQLKNRHIFLKDSLRRDSLLKADDARIKALAPQGIFKNKKFDKSLLADLYTSMGKLTFELYPDRMPFTCENFVNLAKRKFYNKNTFFRLVPDFIIQSGDKTNTGYADAGYYFATEHHPDLSHNRFGMLSMANFDTLSNSSQFFITFSKQIQLDKNHPVFGMIISGQNVLKAMNNIGADSKEKPLKEIILDSILIRGL